MSWKIPFLECLIDSHSWESGYASQLVTTSHRLTGKDSCFITQVVFVTRERRSRECVSGRSGKMQRILVVGSTKFFEVPDEIGGKLWCTNQLFSLVNNPQHLLFAAIPTNHAPFIWTIWTNTDNYWRNSWSRRWRSRPPTALLVAMAGRCWQSTSWWFCFASHAWVSC